MNSQGASEVVEGFTHVCRGSLNIRHNFTPILVVETAHISFQVPNCRIERFHGILDFAIV